MIPLADTTVMMSASADIAMTDMFVSIAAAAPDVSPVIPALSFAP